MTDPSIPDRILAEIDLLSPGETKVARALLENYPELALRSAATIGRTAGASPATVLRCIIRLGFPTFPAFHAALRKEVRSKLSSDRFYEAPSEEAAMPGRLIETELQNLTNAFSRLSPDALSAMREILALPVLWIYGGRFSYSLAHYLHAHLHLLRPRASLLNGNPTPIAEQVVEIGRGHGLVLFDFRDYDLEALFAACYARGRRAQVLLVTDPELSPAARYANHVLAVSVNNPLPSFTAATAAIDALVLDFIQHQAATVTRQSERIADSRQLLQQLSDSENQLGEAQPDQAGRLPQDWDRP
jgi:DNA-binding MurR/RpiR family transcriptional regulator